LDGVLDEGGGVSKDGPDNIEKLLSFEANSYAEGMRKGEEYPHKIESID